MKPAWITFTTDFGWQGGYVAACEAVIARLSPYARMLHISHDVPVGDVAAGALVLARVAPICPTAVHLAVVDPGVGTARRPLMLSAERGDWLIGPDNGLLIEAADALGGTVAAWAVDMERVRLRADLAAEAISTTFHGRDVFAPAAALLASGADPASVARTIDRHSLTRLSPTPAQHSRGGVSAPVIEIDRFGNVGLGVRFTMLPQAADVQPRFLVQVVGDGTPEWTARLVGTYAELYSGELGVICDSWGQAALALNGASAAELLGVRRGQMVTLTLLHPETRPSSVDSDGAYPAISSADSDFGSDDTPASEDLHR